MSTRGAWGFYHNGVNKITYNHCDSHPSGLGETIQAFVSGNTTEELKAIFDRIVMVDEAVMATDEQITECSQYADFHVGSGGTNDWYCLLRQTQGEPDYYKNGLRFMIDNQNFIKNSLFCEWAYVINLDDETLEIYEGYQKKGSRKDMILGVTYENRYFNPARKYEQGGNGHGNCKLVAKYPLSDVPFFWEHIKD